MSTAVDPAPEHATIIMPGARARTHDGRDRSVVVPRVGGRIGRYRLCLTLATGGMSTVYLARVAGAVGHHRFVALKCLKPALAADPAFVEQFVDEARLASQIDHPNVCNVLDYQAQGSVSYLVMELLLGKSLAAVRRAVAARSEALPPAHYAGVVARIIADAAEGLHAAHELTDAHGTPLQVVHRDVSPENVFLTYDGNVKIVDFGVASAARQQHSTQPGTLKGKYCYLQPEVLRGGKPDRRADVWGLGVVAWELLTQRRLFEAEHDVDALRAVLDREISRPSTVRQGLPPALDDIVMRALERDPARRFATARELGRKLTWFIAEERMAIGLASLADLMEQLFPTGRACARQQLETVEHMDDAALADGEDPPTLAGPLPPLDEAVVRSIVDELSGRLPAPLVRRATAAFAAVAAAEPIEVTPVPAPAPAAVPAMGPSGRWLVAAAMLSAATVLAAAVLYLRRDRAERAPAAVTAPAPAAVTASPPDVAPTPVPAAAPALSVPSVALEPEPEPDLEPPPELPALPIVGAPDTDRFELAPVRLTSGEIVYRFRARLEEPSAPPQPSRPSVRPRPAIRRAATKPRAAPGRTTTPAPAPAAQRTPTYAAGPQRW